MNNIIITVDSSIVIYFRNRLKPDAIPTLVQAPNPPKQVTPKRKPPVLRRPPPPKKAKIMEEKREEVETSSCDAKTSDDTKKTLQDENEEKQRKIKVLRTKLSRMKRKRSTEHDSKNIKVKKAIDLISELFDGSIRDFFVSQLQMCGRSKFGSRFSFEDKAFALTLFHSSPKCYRLLKKLFRLPSVTTLKKCMQRVQVLPGFHDTILEALLHKC